MNLKKLCGAVAAVAAFWLSAATPELEWKPGRFGRIAERDGKRFLTVQVPPEAKEAMNCAEAPIDLVPFRGSTLGFRIRARAKDVSIPPRVYNGVKFMLNYVDGNGLEHWHNISGVAGSFDWKELAFSAPVSATAGTGLVKLGLQESSGEVEFDLSSLKIEPLFPAVRSNYKAVYTDRVKSVPPLRGVMSPTREFTEDDWKTLKEWNVNLVRAQLCRNWGKIGTERDLEEYDQWLNAKLDHYEKMFRIGYEKYGLRFVIDLHTPPGGRIENRDMAMFYEKPYADHFIEVWKRIATRFKGNPAVWGYDLVNEPIQSLPAPYDYWNLQRMAAEAVRAIDPDTPIIIESNNSDSPSTFSHLPPLEMKDVIYQVHMYQPGSFTHQRVNNPFGEKGANRAITYPGKIDNREYDREMLRKTLAPVRAFQQKHGARIYVGEFSAVTWAPGAAEYLRDCISLFEEYGWDWTYHAFRESPIWDLEKAGTSRADIRPVPDNDRKQAVLEGLKNNLKK